MNFTTPYSFVFLFILNALAFIFIGYDKWQAIKKKRRISEQTLLTFVLLGGTIGSGLGMLVFRHKTAKMSYLWRFWAIVSLQIAFVYGLFYFKFFSF